MPARPESSLVVFGGLPGVGKTTVARAVAEGLGAAFVRVDEVEAAMWRAGIDRSQPTGLAAYVVAERIAESCLWAGVAVVVDAVNPVEEARRAWRDLAQRVPGAALAFVELVCSDMDEHRRRVEARDSDLDGLAMPTWEQVEAREYEPWTDERLVLDTAEASDDPIGAVERYVARRSVV